MDNRSILTADQNENDSSIALEQAIFTSVPSITSEGYRIIAASPGLKPAEKTMMTRYSPSHGGLTAINALSCYSLGTGRHCISYSVHAGKEHTARGGERVYTQLAVIDSKVFKDKFDFNPLSIHQALAQIVGESPDLKPKSRLNPITIDTRPQAESTQEISCSIDQVCSLANAILLEQRVIVAGASDAKNLLNWAYDLLPFSVREKLSINIGMNFSPARKTQLTFLDQNSEQVKRSIRGQDIRWLDLSANDDLTGSPFIRWLDHYRKWWREGEFQRIKALGSHLDIQGSAQELANILTICEDFKNLDSSDPLVLDNLRIKYNKLSPGNGAEHYLSLELLAKVNERISNLELQMLEA